MKEKKETKIIVAMARPSILKAFKERVKTGSKGIKLNVLISYPFIGGVAADFVCEHRDMIDTLYLDSGAYSVVTGKAQVSLSEYSHYINMFGDKFDHVFTLDDKFDDAEHNQLNQQQLEDNLPKDCAWRPIPAIHAKDALEEIDTHYSNDHRYVALNCQRKDLDAVLGKIEEKYPDLKVHLFGSLNLKSIKKWRPFSADSAGWAHMAKNSLVNYRDSKTEHVVDFSGKVGSKKSSPGTHYIEFSKAHPEFEDYLRDTFKYGMTDLVDNPVARFVANIFFCWKFQQELNK